MKTVGIMHGRERSFPEAFIASVNARGAGVRAEAVAVDAVAHDDAPDYDVIVDRISHEVPFYQTYLKQQALCGTRIVNNPFWRMADDKHFGTALAARLGIAVPKTLLLPQKEYVSDISPESLSNLRLVDWEKVVETVGLPCFLKPADGGGWRSVSKCDSLEELLQAYDESGEQVMMLQEGIRWESYARLLCIGKKRIAIAPWNPDLAHHERYTGASFEYGADLEARMIEQGRVLNEALGYDMNTVEFAVRDGVPYAIDFTNSAPDFDRASLTGPHFDWVVDAMTELVIERAHEQPNPPSGPAHWKQLLA